MTQEYLKSILKYCPLTGIWVWVNPPKEHPRLAGKPAGTLIPGSHGGPYRNIQVDGVKRKSSRLAFLYMTGLEPVGFMDHINGDTTDDRWANLRVVTKNQNAWNVNNTKKLETMGTHKVKSKWQARIRVNGKSISLGNWPTRAEAHEEYLFWRRMIYGRYNNL